MKNVGWLLAKKVLNSTLDSTTPKLDNALSHRQPKFYGPLLGFILTNLLSNSVIAKYAPLDFLKVSYDASPWIPYNRPTHNYNPYQSYDNSWKPIHNPDDQYGPPEYIAEHPATELPPILTTEETHVHHHHHFSRPSQQQIVNIYENEQKPTAIIIESPDDDQEEDTTEISTNIEPPHNIQDEQISRQSEINENKRVKREIPYKYVFNRRTRPRRRYPTTPDYYYDSYEDFSTHRLNQKRKNKPRRPHDSYEDDEYEYDSFEYTTRPYNRKKKRPTPKRKNKYKNKKRQGTTTPDYDDYDAEQVTVALRPRQQTTTTPTTTEASSTSTTTVTTPATMITNGSTSGPGGAPNVTGYGYGPSNGHEGISITYGPPHRPIQPIYGAPRPSYGAPLTSFYNPFVDWRSQQHTRNAIVKKVHNIVGFDDDIPRFT